MVDMHYLGQYYLDFNTFFSFCSGHSILSNGVAQISNKSKLNRRIGEERKVLDAQLCATINFIPMDLIYIVFFLLLVILSSSNLHTIFILTPILMLQSRFIFCLIFHQLSLHTDSETYRLFSNEII